MKTTPKTQGATQEEQKFEDYIPLISKLARRANLKGWEYEDIFQEFSISAFKAFSAWDREKYERGPTLLIKSYIQNRTISLLRRDNAAKRPLFSGSLNDLAFSSEGQASERIEFERCMSSSGATPFEIICIKEESGVSF